MTSFSNSQIPPPDDWQEFQALCRDLWCEIWKDPNTLQNGRNGQPQGGVDIYGRPNLGESWAGVQCKGKDNDTNKKLTKSEVEKEVLKAKSFNPKLSQFIIATTAPRDEKIQEVARVITEKHLKEGFFSVDIWSWDDIKNKIDEHHPIIIKHFRHLLINTNELNISTSESKGSLPPFVDQHTLLKNEQKASRIETAALSASTYEGMATTILTTEHQAELDHARDLINKYNPKEAIDYLVELKDRIWPSAQPIVKFRIVTNIGAAKLALREGQEAARSFIEALQYNPEDEKGLCNYALGNYLLGNLEETKNYANKVLAKNPASIRAHALLIQASFDSTQIESLIASIPKTYRDTPEVAYAISHVYHRRRDLKKAREWLESALRTDKEDTSQLKADLAQILIELATEHEAAHGIQFTDEQIAHFRKAIDLLNDAWKQIERTDLRDSRVDWLINRGVAQRAIGNFEEAIRDIERALEIEPSNARLIFQRALLAYDKGDIDAAQSLLVNILASKDVPEASLFYVWILKEKGNYSDAIATASQLAKQTEDMQMKERARRLLLQLYIDIDNLTEAKIISATLLAEDPQDILYLVDAARILKTEGKDEEAIAHLDEATKQVTGSTSFRERMELGDGYYSLKQFEKAARIYENIINTTVDTPFSRKLLKCYYRVGEFDKALNICQQLREKIGHARFLTETESAIYEETGNLSEAKIICEQYLRHTPDDLEMKIRLAVICYRAREYEALDNILASNIPIDNLTLEYGIQIANLYAARGLDKKAFETIYEVRRRYYDNSKAHLSYFYLFLQREKTATEWLEIKAVDINTAVCVEDESNQKKWYIIEDREHPDLSRGELNRTHPIAQRMMEKLQGDKVLLKESHISTEYGIITEIKSKYVHAFQEVLTSFQTLFPEETGIWSVKVDLSPKEGEMPKGIQTIFDEISRQHDGTLQIQQLYKEGKLTIGAYAKLLNRDALETWNSIIHNPDIGLKCCLGSNEERNKAFELLQKQPKLIIDIISVITLHGVGAANDIVRIYGKLGIAQTTKDLLQNIISGYTTIKSQGFMTIGKEGNQFIRQEVNSESVQKHTEFLESILKWVNENCDVIPWELLPGMKMEEKEHLEEMIGTSFMETILISSKKGNLLYSDDEQLRILAKVEYGVEGIWTQALLMHGLESNKIEKSKYNQCVLRLGTAHYYHTSINADVLMEAAREANWQLAEPFTSVVMILRGASSDEKSALIVGINFLFELWKETPMPDKKKALIWSLIDVITNGRNRKDILGKLCILVKKRFALLPLEERAILTLIETWRQTHLM